MRLDIWTTNADGKAMAIAISQTMGEMRDLLVSAAADFLDLNPQEVWWAIEEEGRCDIQGFCAVPTGTPKSDLGNTTLYV